MELHKSINDDNKETDAIYNNKRMPTINKKMLVNNGRQKHLRSVEMVMAANS
jgi:hypothetical protein